MTAFDDMANAFATFFGIDIGSAGAMLGLILLIVLVIALVWLLGDFMQGRIGPLLIAGIIAFDVQVGWWPQWAIVFIILIVVFALVNPFSEGAGGLLQSG